MGKSLNYTIAIIKPNAVRNKNIGKIMSYAERFGFQVLFTKITTFDKKMAKEFYKDHENKDFFENLIDFTVSGPSMVLILSKENAVVEWRNVMSMVRYHYSDRSNSSANAVHGSDSDEAAIRELNFLKKYKIIKGVTYEQ